MPIVTGTLSDFGLNPLASLGPILVFTPSEAATKNARVFASRPIEVVPQPSGYFEVELASTDGTTPTTWYRLSIKWLDSSGGFDHLVWRLRVPVRGGTIGELLEAPANPGLIWFGPEPPPEPVLYTGWIKTDANPPIYYEWT